MAGGDHPDGHGISIHAPRVGSDRIGWDVLIRLGRFQSTLPVWGATDAKEQMMEQMEISIHAPRVGSDPGPCPLRAQTWSISIHAPRVGSDFKISEV